MPTHYRTCVAAISFILLCGSASCRSIAKSDPHKLASRISADLELSGDIIWLGSGRASTLLDTYYQRRRLKGGTGTFTNQHTECGFLTDNEWAQLPNDLQVMHNIIVSKTATTSDESKKNVNSASKWLTTTARVQDFRVSIIEKNLKENAELGLTVSPAVALNLGEKLNDTRIDLVIAAIAREVSLSYNARECIKRNICALSNNKGGAYIDSALYGSMIRISIDSASLEVKAKAKLEVGENYKVYAGFDLSTNNVSINGGILGEFNSASDIEQRYSTAKLLADLQNKDLLTVSSRVRSATNEYSIIGLQTVSIVPEECTQHQK